MTHASVTALIVAAGAGSRLGGEAPKQFRSLAGRPVLRRAVDGFLGHPGIDSVRVVIGEGQEELARAALEEADVGPLIRGGATRAESVRNGLAAVTDCGAASRADFATSPSIGFPVGAFWKCSVRLPRTDCNPPLSSHFS